MNDIVMLSYCIFSEGSVIMKTQFRSDYKSIKSMDSIDMPDFTLLTGYNGAGKTQILEAIRNGSISLFDGDVALENIVYINSNTNSLDDKSYDNNNSSYYAIKMYIENEKIEELNTKGYMSSSTNMSSDYNTRHLPQEIISEIQNAMSELNIPSDRFCVQDLRYWRYNYKNKVEPFEMLNLSSIFTSYYKRKLQNYLNKEFNSELYLSDEEFIDKYGDDPIKIFNGYLSLFNDEIKIEYNKPNNFEAEPRVKLKNCRTGDLINFNDLSTGEKVIFKVLITIYSSELNLLKKVNVLLLDEIDSGLHPSMMSQFLKYVKEIFIDNMNVKIIMTTHSPTTVALIKESSIFFVQKNDPRIIKISKAEAIKKLTEDIPMLNIDFSCKRKVFVESEKDEKLYTKIYNLLLGNGFVKNDKPLVFISSGISDSDSTGSCVLVKEFCSKFLQGGDTTVYGIVDWDKKNISHDNVLVLSENKKYTIENNLLDPLLIGMLLVKKNLSEKYGLNVSKFIDFNDISLIECQSLINIILDKVGLSDGNCKKIKYCNGFEVDISVAFLELQGHDLESIYKNSFPQLKEYRDLNAEVIDSVIREYTSFCPIDFKELFEEIMSK